MSLLSDAFRRLRRCCLVRPATDEQRAQPTNTQSGPEDPPKPEKVRNRHNKRDGTGRFTKANRQTE